MTKKIIIAIALTAMAVTACGKKDGYKAAKIRITEAEKPAPEDVNEAARQDAVTKAEQILATDSNFLKNYLNEGSTNVKLELQGIAAKLVVKTEKVEDSLVEVTTLTSSSQTCAGTPVSMDKFVAKDNTGTDVPNLGKVWCVGGNCEYLLTILEARRNVRSEGDPNVYGSLIDTSVAVLLKKGENGDYKPVTTNSEKIHNVNSLQVAQSICTETANPTTTSDSLAIKRLQEEQAKREQEDARLKEIETRIAQIDARQKEIADNKIMSDEPKALGIEKSKLIAERDGILSSRPQTETNGQVEAEPVDPTQK